LAAPSTTTTTTTTAPPSARGAPAAWENRHAYKYSPHNDVGNDPERPPLRRAERAGEGAMTGQPTSNGARPVFSAPNTTDEARRERGPFAFLLGLPALRPGAIWSRAIALNAPTLISANALSRWHVDGLGLRNWDGFDGRHLGLVSHHKVALDSGGFIAASHYRGFPWSTRDYLDLAAAAPWVWWAAQDWCVEPEVARDEDIVLDRISGTVRLNMLCLRGGERRGIADRFIPVLQGWHPHHYLRCLDRMPWVLDFLLVGIGSMCRRHVNGEHSIRHVLDVLDRAFSGSNANYHLFGIKSQAIAIAAQHPRVASADSQGLRRRSAAGCAQGSYIEDRHHARWRQGTLVSATDGHDSRTAADPPVAGLANPSASRARRRDRDTHRRGDGTSAHTARVRRNRLDPPLVPDCLRNGLSRRLKRAREQKRRQVSKRTANE
jgi:hypothetical protein